MKYLFFLSVFIGCFSCTNKPDGKIYTFNNGEVYCSENVSAEEANKLGNFLVKDNFFSGNKISVQIDKEDDVYLFRMATIEGAEDNELLNKLANSYVERLSTEVFNGAKVDFHICDTNFKTKKVINHNDILR